MKTVCVTGGAGFIGSHVCQRLINDGYAVVCIDNFLTGSEKNLNNFSSNKHFQLIRQDVTEQLPRLPQIDYIFHLASPASPNHHSSISYHALALETMMVNTVGTHAMLKLALKNKARFMFASTSEVYGDPDVHPQPESYKGNASTTGPRSVYDEAKRFGETLTAYYCRSKEVDTRIVRIFNTYGPHMLLEDKRMIVNFITQALNNKPITIYGNGLQTRSLCYVDDLVEGLMRYMFHDSLAGEIINLGNPEEHSVKEYAEVIKQLVGSKSDIALSEELPEDDPQKRQPDISKAKRILSWEPTINLETGLRKTIEYFKT